MYMTCHKGGGGGRNCTAEGGNTNSDTSLSLSKSGQNTQTAPGSDEKTKATRNTYSYGPQQYEHPEYPTAPGSERVGVGRTKQENYNAESEPKS